VNVLIVPAAPEIYSQDQTGSGPAAALNALTNLLVSSTAPLHAGDYVSLFLTGLGATHSVNGLQAANLPPSVTVGGKNCAVTYAGRAPGFEGLDQINCQLAPDVGADVAAPVVVTSGGADEQCPRVVDSVNNGPVWEPRRIRPADRATLGL